MKRLIVNADDLGYTRDVNEGVLRSHRHGIVRSASLIANGAAFEHAVGLAQGCPELGIGCHLTLVEGESVACPGVPLPHSIAALFVSPPSREAAVCEFGAQVRKLLRHGVRPTHLDTHKHVHLFPQVLDAAAEVANEHGIRWIRKPFDVPLGAQFSARHWIAVALRPLRIAFEEAARRYGCRTTDYFAGFSATGSLTVPWLVNLLTRIPDGVGELVCHPGYCGSELAAAPTKLKTSRQEELGALCEPAVRRAAIERGVEFISYRELPGVPDT